MDKKTVVVVIMLILIAMGLFFIYKQFSSRNKPQSVVQSIGVGVTIPAVNIAAEARPSEASENIGPVAAPVMIVPVAEMKKEAASRVSSGSTFWGNLGYFIKDGKSTFIKYSLLNQMKAEYESGSMEQYLK